MHLEKLNYTHKHTQHTYLFRPTSEKFLEYLISPIFECFDTTQGELILVGFIYTPDCITNLRIP